MYLLPFIICTYFASNVFAVPAGVSILPRDFPPNVSGIITSIKITDHNNIDITSDFQIMIYQEPQLPTNDSLTHNGLLPRHIWESYRPITICYDSAFIESHCTPHNDRAGSLQSYSITCAHMVDHHDAWSGAYQQSHIVHRHRNGFCDRDEICMNGLGGRVSHLQRRQWANCVKKAIFVNTMYGPEGDESKQRISSVLEKGGYRGAYMVMSKTDGTTPTEVDTFNIDTWPAIGTKQSQKCRDCMDFQVDEFAPNINALKAEARLLTTGAAAGILWLALISG